jgi:hypothetical protein
MFFLVPRELIEKLWSNDVYDLFAISFSAQLHVGSSFSQRVRYRTIAC